MPDPSKDFTPIQDDYEFFATQSTEAAADLSAYAERLRAFAPPSRPLRMLDFGCGPGSFTARFLDHFHWKGDQLDLTLVEPSGAYRQQALARLSTKSSHPIRGFDQLPADAISQFDLILSNHVLYYVPELQATLTGIVDALSPGGLFVTAIAGRHNALVDFWFQGFPLIGEPVPYHTAEDVADALSKLGRPFDQRAVAYDLIFPDTKENRLKILHFLFGAHLPQLPQDQALAFFDPYARAGNIEIHTGNIQYYVHATWSRVA